MIKIKNVLNKLDLCAFVFTLITLITVWAPYSSSSTLGNNQLRHILMICLYLLTFISIILVFIPIINEKKLRDFNFFSLLPIIVYFIISNIHVYSELGKSISNIYIVIWLVFCFASKEVKLNTFIYFKKILFFFCVIGIICYLAYVLNLPIKYSVVNYYLHNNSFYINYKIIWLISNYTTPRLCCFYNEPGFLGTIAGLVLCASDLNLKNKENIVIFVAGLLTFSFAFALIVLIYLLLSSFKNWKRFFIILAITIFYIFIFPNFHTGIKSVDRFMQRFTITENGLEGDNRSTGELDAVFDNVMNEKPLLGMGSGYKDSTADGVGIKAFLIDYGIIGLILTYGLLLFSVIIQKNKSKITIVYIIVFFLSIYQRSTIFNIQYQMMLFGGILYLTNNTISDNRYKINLF